MKRNRLIYAALMVVIASLGIASRKLTYLFPHFFTVYAGDTLWAVFVFTLIGFLMPNIATLKAGLAAFLFSLVIELSQLYQAPWIDIVRQTTLGGLILGFSFLWSDLWCYTTGVFIAVLVEWLVIRRQGG